MLVLRKKLKSLRFAKAAIIRSAPSLCISERSSSLLLSPVFSSISAHSGFSSMALTSESIETSRIRFIMPGRSFINSGITSSFIFFRALSVSIVLIISLTTKRISLDKRSSSRHSSIRERKSPEAAPRTGYDAKTNATPVIAIPRRPSSNKTLPPQPSAISARMSSLRSS